MKPKILTWNVRGLNEGNKCLRIRNLLQDWKVYIIFFKRLSSLVCLGGWCRVYGGVIMWIEWVLTLVGRQGGF
jgi:hypothetical protein